MTELEAHWLGSPMPAHRHQSVDEAGAALGDAATRWAQSLLDVARFELARADEKANTLFRFYGVVAALSIGLLAGQGWSPVRLDIPAQLLFWAGCVGLLLSGFCLGSTLYPRDVRGAPDHRLLYFGHVAGYRSVAELARALRAVDDDEEERLVEQLLSVSRLVQAKYASMRRALIALGAGAMLCIAGVLVDTIVRRV